MCKKWNAVKLVIEIFLRPGCTMPTFLVHVNYVTTSKVPPSGRTMLGFTPPSAAPALRNLKKKFWRFEVGSPNKPSRPQKLRYSQNFCAYTNSEIHSFAMVCIKYMEDNHLGRESVTDILTHTRTGSFIGIDYGWLQYLFNLVTISKKF